MSEITAHDLRSMSLRSLAKVMDQGHPVDLNLLEGREYHGVSLGLPVVVDKLLWKTFTKTVYRDPESGKLRGWNIRIQQKEKTWEYLYMTKNGVQITFGHYEVLEGKGQPMPCKWDQGIFLDYGAGGNLRTDPARSMRAPVIAVNEGSAELLLGWEFMRVGPLKVPTPSFWSLERAGEITHVVDRPKR